jgi:guanylate kinase
LLVVIAGPGGVGKDTLAQRLAAEDPRFVVSRSWTTRAPRPGEDRDAYTFVDRATFEERVAAGGFLEWAEYHGNLYGTPTPDPGDARHQVLVIETQGARQVLELAGDDVCIILLEPPSAEILEARLRERGDDDEAVARRLAAAAFEIEHGLALTDNLVVNDDLTQAVADVRRILEGRLSGGNAAPLP